MELRRRTLLGALGGAGVLGTAGTTIYGAANSDSVEQPTALVAGSLLELATQVEGASVEAHGSAAVRRLVLDGLRDPDAVALADPTLFAGLSSTATLFATNSLVLGYDPRSAHASALERDWRATVQRSAVDLGRTDPDLDPLGYRTVMALRLAERRTDIDAGSVLQTSTVVPETELLNVLESGELDAAFVYENMAVQRDLPYVRLPNWMDFSDPSAADQYRQVSYDLPNQTVRGAPIRYGVTATTTSGEEWVERLVTDAARLERLGFGVPDTYPVWNEPVATGTGD